MNRKTLLKEIENVCRNAGYTVRYAQFSSMDGTSDHCRVYENKYIVVNGLLRTDERIDALLSVMKQLKINWNDIYILPEIRSYMIDKGIIDN